MDLLEAANTLKQDNAVLNQTLGVISFHFNLDGLFIYYSTRSVSNYISENSEDMQLLSNDLLVC